jgi:hypothetical protein
MFSRVSRRTGPAAQPVRHCLFMGLCLIACTSANVKSPAAAPAVTHQDSSKFDASEKTHWDFYDGVGTRTPIVLPLPKAGSWQIDDQSTPWWVATNSTLELKLEARLWPERRQVTPEECLSDLQRWRSNLDLSQRANPVQSQTKAVPEGFDSRLTLTTGKLPPGKQGGLAAGGHEAAFIFLVGADVSRCFAFLAEIEPAQAVSQDELMTRAALVTEAIIPKIRLRAIEQRIEPVAH